MGAESRPDGSSPSRRLKRTTAIPTAPKTRTTTATATPRYTWKSELNPAAVSCGRSTGRFSTRARERANWSAGGRLGQEADRAARLEDGVVDVGQIGDVVHPGLGGELPQRDPLAAQVDVERPAVLDEDHALAVDHRADPGRAVCDVGGQHREQR